MGKPTRWIQVLSAAGIAWFEDQVPRRAAGLAYYTSFSVAPLLLLVVLLAGSWYADAEGELLAQVTRLIPGGGEAVRVLMRGLRDGAASGTAAAIGMATLAFGAAGVFGALQDALNEIWGVSTPPRIAIRRFFIRRLFSFAMVIVVAFLLLVSLLINSVMAMLVARYEGLLPGGAGAWQIVNACVAFILAVGVFALIFFVLPDTTVRGRDALVGGGLTAVLFVAGEYLLGWYLEDSGRRSLYGAFGSLIVLLLWVYYSAQIVLFGAEFTKIYGRSAH